MDQDIENLADILPGDVAEEQGEGTRTEIVPRTQKRQKKKKKHDDDDDDGEGCGCSANGKAATTAACCSSSNGKREEEAEEAFDYNKNEETATATAAAVIMPGEGLVFVHSFGCGHNVSDGEYMAGQLYEAGYSISDDFNDKNIGCYVINSCTVKNPSEDHFVTMLRRARSTGKPVVVAGCVPQGDQQNKEWQGVSVVGVRHIDQITHVVDEARKGNVVRLFSTNSTTREGVPKLALPKIRRNKFIEIIPINVGCLNNCTYCKTKHARGDLKSWSVEEIVDRVKSVVSEGVVREIRLTSEDVGAYGIDIGTNIVVLLSQITKQLEGSPHIMLRIGMSNPPYLLKHVEAFADVLLHPNVFEFVHIPVQAGSDAILNVMKREYTVAEFRHCVDVIRDRVPSVSVSTDIICAFPGEGDEEWDETMQLCSDIRFPILNISRFYARRNTPAAAMKQIPTAISKKRSAAITEFYNSYATYNCLKGTTHSNVSLLEVAHDKHHLVGHTKNYVQVLIDPAEANLGDLVDVQIVSVSKYCVVGKVTRVVAKAQELAPRHARKAKASDHDAGGEESQRGQKLRQRAYKQQEPARQQPPEAAAAAHSAPTAGKVVAVLGMLALAGALTMKLASMRKKKVGS